jgi:hypothetical protein
MPYKALLASFLGALLLFAGSAAQAFNEAGHTALEGSPEPAPLPALLENVQDEDRNALEALALYQDPVRSAILEMARHAHVLIALEGIQTRTRTEFQDRIEGLPEAEQEQLWELVRYPDLIADLVAGGRPTRAELEEIAERYPEEVRSSVLALGRGHRALLLEAHQLHSAAEADFEAVMRELHPLSADAFRTGLEHPEVLEILVTRMRLTVVLGEVSRRDPENLDRALSALANETATRTALAREEWIRTLEEDPEARRELEEAARVYAEEEGLEYEVETLSYASPRVTVVVRPYPYWFGFPAVYAGFYDSYYYGDYPYAWYWYPHHRHHYGFYYRPGRQIVVYNFPSHSFLSWYFHRSHHLHYRHLSDRLFHHHSVHRYSHDRVASYVEGWKQPKRRADVRSREELRPTRIWPSRPRAEKRRVERRWRDRGEARREVAVQSERKRPRTERRTRPPARTQRRPKGGSDPAVTAPPKSASSHKTRREEARREGSRARPGRETRDAQRGRAMRTRHRDQSRAAVPRGNSGSRGRAMKVSQRSAANGKGARGKRGGGHGRGRGDRARHP